MPKPPPPETLEVLRHNLLILQGLPSLLYAYREEIPVLIILRPHQNGPNGLLSIAQAEGVHQKSNERLAMAFDE